MSNELLSNYVLASSAARYLGLSSRYFQDKKESLSKDIIIRKSSNLLWVKLPKEVIRLHDDGYMAVKMSSNENSSDYEHFFNLTDKVTIGFWK